MSAANRLRPSGQRSEAKIERLWNTCPFTDYVSDYDLANFTTYALLLDAEIEGADELDMARIFFGIDPMKQQLRAERVVRSHLKRARWMLDHGYPFLIW